MKTFTVPSFESGEAIMLFGSKLDESEGGILDFSEVGFAKPAGMILLSQFISRAVREGKVHDIIGAGRYTYPANMGFYQCCGLEVPRHDAPGNGNYLPLKSVDLAAWRQAAIDAKLSFGELADQRVGRMAYLIARTGRGDLFDLIKYCLREIVRNALEHGEGETLWIAGQYWPQSHEVELSIFDNGIGVRRGIIQNEKFAGVSSDRDAIRLAIMPSTSGKKMYGEGAPSQAEGTESKWDNSGFGLYVTSQLARESGYFVIGSGENYQQLSGPNTKTGTFGLSGTFISMHFDVEGLRQTAARVDKIVDKGEAIAKRRFASGGDVTASAASKSINS